MKNLRFNRFESESRSSYISDFEGLRNFGGFVHDGFLKCKLVHHSSYSVILPDQIYFQTEEGTYWIQPLFFSAPSLPESDQYGQCEISVDISCGECLKLSYESSDVVSWLEDGSILYACKIIGPKSLYEFRTGDAIFVDGVPKIRVFHHTSPDALTNIEKSKEFWSSSWNIQGTKQCKNQSYLYLTSLPKIVNIDDLTQIAMSSEGRLAFRIDSNFTNNPDLVLKVYRDSTENRTSTLSYWVSANYLSPQHCYRHSPPNNFVYYAIVSPFILRVGVEAGSTLSIAGEDIIPNEPKLLNFAIVGDATNVDGLRAPYDEEDSKEKLMVEFCSCPNEFIGFWQSQSNRDLFASTSLDEIEYDQSP